IRRVEESGHARVESHCVSRKEKIEEELFLGLRKLSGVPKQRFYMKFGKSLHDIYDKQIEELKNKGWMVEDDERIALTRKGLLLGNEVFQEFLLS
ncbi:MAG: oxygen-independent coproporphyrinogen III oxidase, partial [Tuberibacillus sp.]